MNSKKKLHLNRSLTNVKLTGTKQNFRKRQTKTRENLSTRHFKNKIEKEDKCHIKNVNMFGSTIRKQYVETIKREVIDDDEVELQFKFENVDIESLDVKSSNMFLPEETPQEVEDEEEITEKFVQALSSHLECVKFLQIRGLISACAYCPSCGRRMELTTTSRNSVAWFCNGSLKGGHRGRKITRTPFRASFMEGSRLQPTVMLTLVYYFSKNITDVEFLIRNVTLKENKISRKVITDVLFLCREVCLMWAYEHCNRQKQLGGGDFPVEVVQINCGDKDAQSCILVLFEHHPGERGQFVLDVCCDNSEKSLVTFISKYVKDNGKIATTLLPSPFQSYVQIFRVNRGEKRLEFVNEMWELNSILDSAKTTVARTLHSKDLTYTVGEFLYRRQVDLDGADPFSHFLDALKQFYPCPNNMF